MLYMICIIRIIQNNINIFYNGIMNNINIKDIYIIYNGIINNINIKDIFILFTME
jgi:hypothetical protein